MNQNRIRSQHHSGAAHLNAAKKAICAFVASAAAIANAAALADEAREATRLEPVLVTATLAEVEQRDAPAATSVVSSEQIKQSSGRDLTELLRETTGVSLIGRGVGNRRVLTLRGMESHHTLVLVDGRRVSASDAVIGHSDFQNSWAPTEAIEQIEVVRGPMSSLYGSDGMGGVINIITKKPTDDWSGSIRLSAGTLQDDRDGAENSVSINAGGALMEGLRLRIDAEHSDHEKTQEEGNPQLSEAEGKESRSLGLTLSYDFAEAQQLELHFSQSDEQRPRDTISRRGVAHESTYDLDRTMMGLRYKGQLGETDVSAQLYRSSIDASNSTTNGVAVTTPQKLTDTVLESHATRALGDMHLLTAGFEIRNEELDHAMLDGGNDSIRNNALFLQDEIRINNALGLTLGARLDDHELFGNEFSPRAYVVYKLSDVWSIKGGYGEGFRAPTIKQISPNYRFEGFHTFVGNPDIGPETSATFELALQYHGENTKFGLTAFRNDVDDLIQTNCIVNCDSRRGREFEYINVSEARIDGLELDVAHRVSEQVELAFNLTQLDTENRSSGEDLYFRPELSANMRLSWYSVNRDWSVVLRGQYIGTQVDDGNDLPSYDLWHLNIGKRFGDNLSLRVGMDNIADERLGEKDPNFSFEERGRFFYFGLEYGI